MFDTSIDSAPLQMEFGFMPWRAVSKEPQPQRIRCMVAFGITKDIKGKEVGAFWLIALDKWWKKGWGIALIALKEGWGSDAVKS